MVVLDRAKKVIEKTFDVKFDKVLSPHEWRLLELITVSTIAGTISGVIIRQIYINYVERVRAMEATGSCASCTEGMGPAEPYILRI